MDDKTVFTDVEMAIEDGPLTGLFVAFQVASVGGRAVVQLQVFDGSQTAQTVGEEDDGFVIYEGTVGETGDVVMLHAVDKVGAFSERILTSG